MMENRFLEISLRHYATGYMTYCMWIFSLLQTFLFCCQLKMSQTFILVRLIGTTCIKFTRGRLLWRDFTCHVLAMCFAEISEKCQQIAYTGWLHWLPILWQIQVGEWVLTVIFLSLLLDFQSSVHMLFKVWWRFFFFSRFNINRDIIVLSDFMTSCLL